MNIRIWDELVSTEDIEFSSGKPVKIRALNAENEELLQGCGLSEWAVGQVCVRFGLRPWVVWSGLSCETAATTLNEIIASSENRRYLVRGYGNVIRAFVSSKWVALDNEAILNALFDIAEPEPSRVMHSVSLYNERFVGFASTRAADSRLCKSIEGVGVAAFGSEVGSLRPYAVPYIEFSDVAIPVTKLKVDFDGNPDQEKAAIMMVQKASERCDKALDIIERVAWLRVPQDTNVLVDNLCVYAKAREHKVQCRSIAGALAEEDSRVTAVTVIRALAMVADQLPALDARVQLLEACGTAITNWRPPRG